MKNKTFTIIAIILLLGVLFLIIRDILKKSQVKEKPCCVLFMENSHEAAHFDRPGELALIATSTGSVSGIIIN